MGITIALLISITSYRSWMILSRRSYMCEKKSYNKILFSLDILDRLLIIQHNWRALLGMEDCAYEAFEKGADIF